MLIPDPPPPSAVSNYLLGVFNCQNIDPTNSDGIAYGEVGLVAQGLYWSSDFNLRCYK